MHPIISRYREELVFLLLFLTVSVSLSYYLLAQYRVLGKAVFPLDDAWIHLNFARNIAESNEFAFNSGHPIASSTAPLWTLLLGITHKVIPNLDLVAYLWGAACLVLTAFASYKVTYFMSESRIWSLITGFFVAANPWLAWAALSGMEITLSAFLILLSIYFFLIYGENRGWKRFIGIAIAALSMLTRPELCILVLVLLVLDIRREISGRKGRRSLIKLLSISLVIIIFVNAPYSLFALSSCGQLFPCTYNAKVGGLGLLGVLGKGDLSAIVEYLTTEPFAYWGQFIRAFWNFESIFFLLWLPSLLFLLLFFLRRKDERLLVFPAFFFLFTLIMGLFIPKSRFGFPWNRYLQNLLPLFIISSLLGFYYLIAGSKRASWRYALIALIALALLTASGNQWGYAIPYVRDFYVDCGYTMRKRHFKIAQWLNENVGSGEIIAVSDIGYIGYTTRRFLVDTEGLITPGILGETRDGLEKDALIYQYLQEAGVTYLATFKAAYPGLPRERMEIVFDADPMAVYRMLWGED